MPEKERYGRSKNIQSTAGTASTYRGDEVKASRKAKRTMNALSGIGVGLSALALVATGGAAAPALTGAGKAGLGLLSLGSGAASLGASGAAAKKGSIDQYLASPPGPSRSS